MVHLALGSHSPTIAAREARVVFFFFSIVVGPRFRKHHLLEHYICLSLSKLTKYRCQDLEHP